MSTVSSSFVCAASKIWTLRDAYADGGVGQGLVVVGPGQFGPIVTRPISFPVRSSTMIGSVGESLWPQQRTAAARTANRRRFTPSILLRRQHELISLGI